MIKRSTNNKKVKRLSRVRTSGKTHTFRVAGAVQKDIMEWAIEPMEGYFMEQLGRGEIKSMPEIPTFKKGILTVPHEVDVVQDLLYRLEEQYQDVMEDNAYGVRNPKMQARSAMGLAKKIRESTGFKGSTTGAASLKNL